MHRSTDLLFDDPDTLSVKGMLVDVVEGLTELVTPDCLRNLDEVTALFETINAMDRGLPKSSAGRDTFAEVTRTLIAGKNSEGQLGIGSTLLPCARRWAFSMKAPIIYSNKCCRASSMTVNASQARRTSSLENLLILRR